MADPTIRERLRELLRDAITTATAQDRESIFLRPNDARALLDELDTLERRAVAAEERLDAAIRHGYYRGQADERYQRGDRDELAIRLWREEERDRAALVEARAALEASRGSA